MNQLVLGLTETFSSFFFFYLFFSSFRLVKEARDGPRLGVYMVGVAEQLGLAANGSGRLVRAAV